MAIDVLLQFREEAGVHHSNNYLFARGDGSSEGKFDGNVCLSDAAESCGAAVPESITTTNLRKHLASVSQALNMTDSDLKTLSGFLGHTEKTHLQHYRLPSDALHTAKLSKLLLALDEGTISKYRGKSIEDIDVSSTVAEIEEELGISRKPTRKVKEAVKEPTHKILKVTTPSKFKSSVTQRKPSQSPKKNSQNLSQISPKFSRSPKNSPKKSPEPLRRRWTS